MRSVRTLVLVCSAILGFAVLAPSASHAAAAPAFVPFTVTKTCIANPTFSIPGECTISTSSIAALVGAKIFYYGPLPPNATFLASTVVLKTVAGDTASGYCNVYRAAPGGPVGICAFHDGSGALAGLEAVANVTVDTSVAPAIWSWVGVETHTP